MGVVRLELAVGGGPPVADTLAPWRFDWDTTRLPNGAYTLVATAFDQAGNQTAPAPVFVHVDNPGPPQPPEPTELTIAPGEDATVRADKPGTRYGSETTIATDGDPVKRILLRFPLAALDGRTVERARLRLHGVGTSRAGGDSHGLGTAPWDESTVMWKNAPVLVVEAGS